MNKIFVNKKRLIFAGVLIVFIISLVVCALSISNNKVFAYASIENQYESTTNTGIQDELVDNSVIVVLDEKVSGINKIHSSNFFTGIEIDKIIDLTRRNNNVKNRNKTFRQILQIYLKQTSEDTILQTVNKLEQIDGVLSVEPNYPIEPAMVPDDVKFSDQWNLNDTNGINMSGAWDFATGSKNVRVGIIDSGIVNHPDLSSNLVQGFDYYNGNNITTDDTYGHGTKVAGVIGAIGNNSQGVAGINWNVTMIPLQVSYLGDDNKTYFDRTAIVRAINEATDKWGTTEQIDIINYSGSNFGNASDILNAVADYPGLFVWSAGNNGVNVDSYSRIEDYELNNLISVGAIDKSNERSIWSSSQSSCYGSHVNIYAPGGKEFINGENIPTTNNSNGYTNTFNGTSAAAPHVAGVAALLLSYKPTSGGGATTYSSNNNLDAAALKSLILNSADNIEISIPSGGKQIVKKLNAYKALGRLAGEVGSNVTFDKQGGVGGTDSVQAYHGEQMPNITYPSKFGYNCKNYLDENGKTYYTNPGKLMVHIKHDCDFYIDKTLYAKWEPKNYELTFTIEGVDGETEVSYGQYSFDDTVTVTAKSYEGYKFVKWWDGVTSATRTIKVSEIVSQWATDEQGEKPNSGGILLTDSPAKTYHYFGGIVYEKDTGGGSCITSDSLITLSDGTKKPVADLTGDEMLLVWDMNTGRFASAPILFIDIDEEAEHKIINLSFSDGTTVEVIYEHAFWDFNLNEYIFLREDAAKYIGHWFNKQTTDSNDNLTWTSVQLTEVTITQEYTTAYSPVTYGHLCYYVNGMLSMPGATEGLINIFEVDGAILQYNIDSMSSDIENYGLFTYEEFAEIYPVSEYIFNAFSGQYLKVSIGKGLITLEEIGELINRYAEFLN